MSINYFFSILIILPFSNFASGQAVIASTGNSISSNTGNLSYTVGQIDYQFTSSTGIGNLSAGVQQVFNSLPFTYTANIDKTTTISVWPNPVIDKLFVKINSRAFSGFSYKVIDMNGRLIENNKTYQNSIKIDTHHYTAGIYLLVLDYAMNSPILFKITKQ
jgi:hypothetical protein